MRKVLFLLVLTLGFTQVRADEPENSKPAAKETTMIEGKVMDNLTGEVLAGVSLKLSGSEMKTYSDLDGNFKFEGIPTGTYDIEIDYVSYKDITLKDVSTSESDVKLKVQLEPVIQSY